LLPNPARRRDDYSFAEGRVVHRLVETVRGVTDSIEIPVWHNGFPTLTVHWDEAAFGLTVAQCDDEMARGESRIEVMSNKNASWVHGVPRAAGRHPARLLRSCLFRARLWFLRFFRAGSHRT
jgi:hypothetical protein